MPSRGGDLAGHPLLTSLLTSPEVAAAEAGWRSVFRPDVEPPRVRPITAGYWLCMTPRSGSSWLASMLEQTGQLGRPHEFFALELPFIERNPSSGFADYLARVKWMSGTSNGIFAVKGNAYQITPLVRRGLFTSTDVPYHYVYLTRQDVVRQAISLYRAMESGGWTSRSEVVREPRFDAKRIWTWVDWIIRMMGAWETIFAAMGIQPLRVTYEEIDADPRGHVERIAAHVGVSSSVLGPATNGTVTRQRTGMTDEWAARLRSTGSARKSS